jgi:hypothetical protein
MCRTASFTWLLLSFAALVLAQNFRGGINGIVADQSGAVIAGSQVTAANEATGLVYSTVASSAGEFSFADLPLGSYTVNITHSGFSVVRVSGVRVTAGNVYNLPVTLTVASTSSTVEVSAAALALETTNTTLVSAVPTTAVQNLPMNARDFTQLIATVPGWAGNSSNGLSGGLNGMRQNQINWQIDGTDNNDPWWNFPATNQTGVSSIAAVVVPLDSIEEFNLVTQGNAEMGRSPGGTVNLIMRSGTNGLHGSAYDYERNEALAARSPFLPASQHKPEVRNRNYGFSLGGPIRKDKTFFFTSYEAQKYALSAAAPTTEPSQAYQQAALNLLQQNGIPVNPVSATLLTNLWPAGALTGPAAANNYIPSTLQTGYNHNGIIKVDHNFNDKNRLSLRAFDAYGFQIGDIGDHLPDYYAVTPVHSQNYNAILNTTFGPNLQNQLLFGSNYFDLKKQDQNISFQPIAMGLNTGVNNVALRGSPFFKIGNFDVIGSTPKVGRDTVNVSTTDTVSYIRGSHQLRFGGGFNIGKVDGFYRAGGRGNFTFNGLQGPWKSLTIDNNILSLADFLAGYVYQSSLAVGDPERFVNINGFNFFVHDSWQVTRKLNLNYGLRYEYTGPLHNDKNDLTVFDPAVQGGLAVVGKDIPNLYPQYWKNILPRAGFAYQPTSRGNLVIRGGVGLYTDTVSILPFLNNSNSLASYGAPNGGPIGVNGNPAGSSPVYLVQKNAYTIVPNQLLFPSVPSITGTTVINLFGVNLDLRPAQVLGYNLNIEKSLGPNVMIQVGYVGMESRHLITLQDVNQAALGSGTTVLPSGFTRAQASRPYFGQFPNFGVINTVESNGNANYNSLQMQLRTTSWHHLITKANFTWSHNLDDMTSNSGTLPQNSFDLKGNYGNSDNDRRLQFNGFLVYEIPGSSHGPTWLTHGWEATSVLAIHTGAPLTPKAASDTTGTGENVLYANYIGGDPYASGSHDVVNAQPVQWLNPAAFANPAAGTYGTIGRGMIFAPGFESVDLSIIKTIPIRERARIQFHADMFNLFNHTNLSGTSSTVGSSGFGKASSTPGGTGAPGIGVGEPFNMQLAVKVLW